MGQLREDNRHDDAIDLGKQAGKTKNKQIKSHEEERKAKKKQKRKKPCTIEEPAEEIIAHHQQESLPKKEPGVIDTGLAQTELEANAAELLRLLCRLPDANAEESL